jgi:hypothetical protein
VSKGRDAYPAPPHTARPLRVRLVAQARFSQGKEERGRPMEGRPQVGGCVHGCVPQKERLPVLSTDLNMHVSRWWYSALSYAASSHAPRHARLSRYRSHSHAQMCRSATGLPESHSAGLSGRQKQTTATRRGERVRRLVSARACWRRPPWPTRGAGAYRERGMEEMCIEPLRSKMDLSNRPVARPSRRVRRESSR